MRAATLLQKAIIGLLEGEPALEDLSVFDAPPVRSTGPNAIVEDPVLRAFDGSQVTGRIGTLAISFADTGEIPTRLRVLMAIAEETVDQLTGLSGGWRIGGIALARSRLARTKDGWLGRSEWAVRLFRVN